MHARFVCLLPCTGTGGNPSLGEQAAEESASTITSAVGNADMVRTCHRLPSPASTWPAKPHDHKLGKLLLREAWSCLHSAVELPRASSSVHRACREGLQ